jgi:hypothetical protein
LSGDDIVPFQKFLLCLWVYEIVIPHVSKDYFGSFTGIFEYNLVMSIEAKLKCGNIGASFRFWIKSLVFFMFKACGSGVRWLIFCVNSLDSL